jgi:hypothetical protein
VAAGGCLSDCIAHYRDRKVVGVFLLPRFFMRRFKQYHLIENIILV